MSKRTIQFKNKNILRSIVNNSNETQNYLLIKRSIMGNKNKSKALVKLLNSIDISLSESSLIKPLKSTKYSIDINKVLNKFSFNELKRINYYKQWYPSHNSPLSPSSLLSIQSVKQPITNFEKISLSESTSNQLLSNELNTQMQKTNTYFGLMLDEKRLSNSINNTFLHTLRFKSFSKKQINAKIIKKSIAESVKNSPMRSYANKLHNNIEKYIHYAEKYNNIYEFDDWVRQSVIDDQTGISIPGNVLNCFNESNTNKVNNIRVFHPSNIKEKPKLTLQMLNRLPVLKNDGRPKNTIKNYNDFKL